MACTAGELSWRSTMGGRWLSPGTAAATVSAPTIAMAAGHMLSFPITATDAPMHTDIAATITVVVLITGTLRVITTAPPTTDGLITRGPRRYTTTGAGGHSRGTAITDLTTSRIPSIPTPRCG